MASKSCPLPPHVHQPARWLIGHAMLGDAEHDQGEVAEIFDALGHDPDVVVAVVADEGRRFSARRFCSRRSTSRTGLRFYFATAPAAIARTAGLWESPPAGRWLLPSRRTAPRARERRAIRSCARLDLAAC